MLSCIQWCIFPHAGLDEAGALELKTIKDNLTKQKVKMGKVFDDIAVEETDWVGWVKRMV